jgi:hypothetical protein
MYNDAAHMYSTQLIPVSNQAHQQPSFDPAVAMCPIRRDRSVARVATIDDDELAVSIVPFHDHTETVINIDTCTMSTVFH